MTDDELRTARRLRCQLKTQSEIAEEIDYTRGAVGKRLRGMGLTGKGDPVYGAVRSLLIAKAKESSPSPAYVQSKHLASELPCTLDFIGMVLRDIAEGDDQLLDVEKWNSSTWAVEVADGQEEKLGLDIETKGDQA